MKILASLSVPSASDSRPVALAQKPAAQPVRVDARFAGQHAEEELLLRHLEAEDADRHVGLRADVLRDVEREAGLPHRRTGRDDHQIRGLEPGRHLVEIGEAGRHPGDELLAGVELLDRIEARLRELAQRNEAVAHLLVRDGEDGVLGLVEQIRRVGACVEGRAHEPGGDLDHAAQLRLLAHDRRMVLDVRGRRHRIDGECSRDRRLRRAHRAAPARPRG